MNCDLDTSIPDWIIEHPETLSLFGELGFDTSCAGKSLGYVCRQQGYSPSDVVQRLKSVVDRVSHSATESATGVATGPANSTAAADTAAHSVYSITVISITVILLSGQRRVVSFRRQAYNNLMELIVNELYENIGDCKGHAWCGTCHLEIVSGELLEERTLDESQTLGKLPNTLPTSRLACQIMTDEQIDGLVFRVIGDV